jgi:hypothetical protein
MYIILKHISLNKMPFRRDIIYPIFLECCKYCNDIFWESVFEDLAYGKAPQGTYISKDFLCCSYKNKEFNYKIERKDPEVLYHDLYNLLSKKVGLLSFKEKLNKKQTFHEIESDIKKSREDWSCIRKKNIKDIMYENFVIDMKNKFNLTLKQTKNLLSMILLSITFKTITSKDIVYNNNKIESIDGIQFEKHKVIYKKPFCDGSSIPKETYVKQTKIMHENWDKYLKSLV